MSDCAKCGQFVSVRIVQEDGSRLCESCDTAMTAHVPPTEAELEESREIISGPSRQGLTKPAQLRLIAEIRRLRAIIEDWITHPKLQRMWDLCRHQRNELHRVNLISDDEFAALAEDDKSVDRLETYDAAREEIRRLRELCREVRITPGCNCSTCNHAREVIRAASEGR